MRGCGIKKSNSEFDRELGKRFQNGDLEAGGALYKMYQPKLIKYICSLANMTWQREGTALVKDIAGETWLKRS